jgi:N-acetylgalactosamine kinase
VLGVAGSLTKGDVSEFTCTAERHVGVTSGGMDQAISVMGMPGVAMLVEFNPVRD